MNEVKEKGKLAKEVSYTLANVSTEEKNDALLKISEQLLKDKKLLIAENQRDIIHGKAKGYLENILDRMLLNEKRIEDMAAAIKQLVELQDPIGQTIEMIEKENGLKIEKKKVPLGVIGMIYEARPNVTVDAATLALKTSNCVILRGSSSAIHSNKALVQTIHRALEKTSIPVNAVQLIEDTSRETAKELFHLNEYLDVLIPRGGKALIQTVVNESTVPVLETGAGNCHLYIDKTAKKEMAIQIALNAKIQRPSVCNAIETILIHDDWFKQYGIELLEALTLQGVEIYGDERVVQTYSEVVLATDEDWYAEYLALKVSVKIVSSTEEAIKHIHQYGTKHSEAIITEDNKQAQIFLNTVDAAAVYHNASTRFTDGFEFGYGAEIGISTQKLHARGPMGLEALTSSKYFIYGSGQVRQ
ncbi:glutamate-5-semialdehyde dehydrogenase [Heyndrickxia ginsengihumi]|uniref:Gamma-glutamyl phosphate reductase n=1 Tax=Heyndrickxia ginsengihumi TaxID=363870 RepID=A0A6M0P8D4_9BACI|nr:glutamate-5-semialdehyde dehydrogenase [Heyndrickxia ginsengihumi]MBE6183180.1 glutamate-5-semialdehyde dehydrogenase [Bacillus sp. (in: firmicutes)]MCM3023852.1 glutamate-5-semialdehyde dehydrogenase [Heyndrickxia ginsengihumi]NEY20727.1 glutamate-5-semialdehyde dehydrogenase [Heyndrickxia ginsengihumi]